MTGKVARKTAVKVVETVTTTVAPTKRRKTKVTSTSTSRYACPLQSTTLDLLPPFARSLEIAEDTELPRKQVNITAELQELETATLGESWQTALKAEFSKPYFKEVNI